MRYLLFPCLLLLTGACGDNLYDTDFEAGEDFTDSNVRVLSIDTLTVEMSTIKFDSLITSGATRILVGQYMDTVFGKTTASSYFELLPDSYNVDNNGVYDSISLFLGYDQYYYNDTLRTSSIHVKRLTSRVKPVDGDSFYNTQSIAHETESLGQLSFIPRPLGGTDSVEIELNDDFGRELFERIQQKNITTNDQLREYFKGFTLQPGDHDNGAVVGYTTSPDQSFLRVYYSTHETEEPTVQHLDFAITTESSPPTFFNRIAAEDSETPFHALTDKKVVLPSTETGHRTYIQSGTGITTRIRFPSVKTLYDIEGTGTVLNATLKIKPTNWYYDKNLPLKDTLNLYLVDQNNDITEQLTNMDPSTPLALKAVLNRENQEFGKLYFEVPLGTYIERLFTATREDRSALVLLPSEYSSTVDRMVLNGENNADYRATLEVTYAVYDEDDD
ncbi:DUF4270 family protein [Sinomicrobium weinanense]|uniref:DUF4270 family protein n=1 Tax=Sinomicrobium weinanense TaxID=2842200 RepID=A0A926JPN3_9FLAO|nr:DUF4270 family protein [Sinomicrobium weinanense]MBC9795018.1 DUF4270 family protein [Sinomicrobium weinanense]MBU3125121.1 DUF4270 domain-containing protein [Sinomicrobium weinanense]